ncbi:FmdE family protein [Qiania dongpingensis]|uniref:TraR/DksA C4-type zinc finger protein n=1 Tax=Qiania dongpingensis TaxID=2763669 RepID=A0A7G9G2M1_9FIRM|nr:FmdE family protein [Qiania dongpingensis]QNM05053.1 TraR/DksA C4-type zinc finger protein [Qiania dongpingensis]
MEQDKWRKCVEFHGHECPGLAIGFRVGLYALEWFGGIERAEDEELVCVTENDACGVDAVQVLTGCTMGKGNLLYRGTGKMAFSFFLRKTGKGVRVVLKPGKSGTSREERQREILENPFEELFWVKEPGFSLPDAARIFADETCEICGEASPDYKMHLQGGKKVCVDCFQDYSRGW